MTDAMAGVTTMQITMPRVTSDTTGITSTQRVLLALWGSFLRSAAARLLEGPACSMAEKGP